MGGLVIMLFDTGSIAVYRSRREKELQLLSKEQQDLINRLGNCPEEDKEFVILAREQNYLPNEGDFFAISPRIGLYFFGQVLKHPVTSDKSDYFFLNKSLVVIFKEGAISMDSQSLQRINRKELLVRPLIVDKWCWDVGQFKYINTGSLELNEEKYDIGFAVLDQDCYVSADGEHLAHIPTHVGLHSVTPPSGITYEVERALIANPQLLVTERKSFPVWGSKEYFSMKKAGKTEVCDMDDIPANIAPLLWMETEGIFTVCIDSVFLGSANAGLDQGEQTYVNGYTIEAMAQKYIDTSMPNVGDEITFDSEASLFSACSSNKSLLIKFAEGFSVWLKKELDTESGTRGRGSIYYRQSKF